MSKALFKTTLCAAAFAATAPAHAASVTISILDVAFENPTYKNDEYAAPVGAAPVIIDGTVDDDAVAVRWGYDSYFSRYEFDPVDVDFDVSDTNPFLLGDFYHYNIPIWSDSKFLDTVDLNVVLGATFHDGGGEKTYTEMTANFRFGHLETPNTPDDPNDCATVMAGPVGDKKCSDQVTLVDVNLPSFAGMVGNENVNLEVLGFGDKIEEIGNYFWTTEGEATSSPLFAQFSFSSKPGAPEDPTGDPSPVPLPAAAWLLIAGVGSLAATRKLRRKA